jgi:hypothetical protein
MPTRLVATRFKSFVPASLLLLAACAADSPDDAAGASEPEGDALSAEEARGAKPSAAAATQQLALFGSNSCQNADIRVVNSLDFPITVRSLDYYNGTEQRWQHEDLDNKVVVPGAMEFWTPNFANTKDDYIYSFDVNFDHDEDAAGNPIPRHDHSYHINTPDTRCNTGVVYLLEIQ